MFDRLTRGMHHTATIISAAWTAPKRELFVRMVAFSRALPQQFNQPLPEMMRHLTPGELANTLSDNAQSQPGVVSTPLTRSIHPPAAKVSLTADEVRHLADAVAAWHLRSPLGVCLRRSLLRYHFLREVGLPVNIVFGARLKDSQEGGSIGGHAWLTLDGSPYYENPDDYAGFAVMYTYPVDNRQ